jgi:hypothetical protein
MKLTEKYLRNMIKEVLNEMHDGSMEPLEQYVGKLVDQNPRISKEEVLRLSRENGYGGNPPEINQIMLKLAQEFRRAL